MADTPEYSEPFSPSIFLDLPPTPRADGDDPPASGDLALPFISRMLMEEEDINLLYQCPVDHPALLMVQQPFAEILSDSDAATVALSSDASTCDDVISNGSAELGDAAGQSRASLNNLKEDTVAITGDLPRPADDGDQQLLGAQVVQAAEEDVLKLAFLKGMEEANKFLPTFTTNLLLMCNRPGEGEHHQLKKHSKNRRRKDEDDDDSAAGAGGKRNIISNSKRMMVSLSDDEEADGETVDKMIINDFNSCLGKMTRLHITADGGVEGKKKPAAAAHDLHTLLVHCAQAVGSNDRWSAAQLLGQIKKLSSPAGDANQRLADCFAEGLEARLAGTGAQQLYSNSKRTPSVSVVEYLKAYQLYLDACCFRMTSFTFSNRCILKAVAAGTARKKKRVHIVDYGIDYGWQWPALLSRFAAMEGGPPEVRITGIDLPQPGFRPSSRLDETGRRLSSGARQLGVPFQFRSIAAAKWETVRADDIRSMDDDELLVVNSLCPFGNLADEGADVDSPSPRDAVLRSIRELRPDLFILCAANASHSSPFFVRRFRDALSYYSAMFDMVDATIPPRDNEQQRLLIERHVLGRGALNVVACEGPDRVERPEPYRQWQARNRRAGLRQLPLDPVIVDYVKERVRSLYHRDFFIDTDQQWLLQGWKGRILYAMSTWVAHDHPATDDSARA